MASLYLVFSVILRGYQVQYSKYCLLVSYKLYCCTLLSYELCCCKLVSYNLCCCKLVSYNLRCCKLVSYELRCCKLVSYELCCYKLVSYKLCWWQLISKLPRIISKDLPNRRINITWIPSAKDFNSSPTDLKDNE